MFHIFKVLCLTLTICSVYVLSAEITNAAGSNSAVRTDLDSSATSAKLFNLGNLFGQTPGYGSGGYGSGGYGSGGYYPGGYRPYYPSTGYYPTTGGSYYPSGWSGSSYPNYNYYTNTAAGGGGYYPSTAGGYYPSSGYYPSTGGGYYPSGGGTNILGGAGNGGYGGYGGNGGLRQYYGYWNPDYVGYRNRGYGYFADTDRYGLPARDGSVGSRERDRVSDSYRGYD